MRRILPLLLLVGCTGLVRYYTADRWDAFYGNRERFTPEYRELYDSVEACLVRAGWQIPGNVAYDSIHWYQADRIRDKYGYDHLGHVALPDTITILRGREWTNTPAHELVHYLLQGTHEQIPNWPTTCARIVAWRENMMSGARR